MIKKTKDKSWEDFAHKIEKEFYTDQQLFYKVLKGLRAGKKRGAIKQIRDSQGELVRRKEDIMDIWKTYFQKWLCSKGIGDRSELVNEGKEQGEEPKISMEEAVDAIKKLKKGKAAGHDKINGEMMKNMGVMDKKCLPRYVIKLGTKIESLRIGK